MSMISTDSTPPPALTVKQLLQLGSEAGLPALEARMLLMHCTGLSRTDLITRDDMLPAATAQAEYKRFVHRRQHGEPMAYILGAREFYGRMFAATPAVLIPRPDTETIVEWMLEVLSDTPTPAVLDLGTGSGIIAITMALERSDAHVLACDVSAEAIEVARRNAANLGADNVTFVQSDWYSAVPARTRFNLIVSNPPYIASTDQHLQQGDLRFEPVDALTDRACGLSALRTIIGQAPAQLTAQGWLMVEHGYDQGEAVRTLFVDAGFTSVTTRRDLAGHERCTGGRLAN